MKKLLLLVSALVIVAFFLFRFIISRLNNSAIPKEIFKQIEVINVNINEENVLKAKLQLPDYSVIFESCYKKVENETKDEPNFEKKLFEIVSKEAKQTKKMIVKDILINLSIIDPEKEEWTQDELIEIASERVFYDEVEEFCMDCITKEITLDFYGEVQP